MKKQNGLIEKLIKKLNMLEGYIIFLESKLAVSETVSKLLEKNPNGLEAYCRSARCEKRKKMKIWRT